MLLQNLHHRYLYIIIRLPHLKDLDQKIPSFTNCDNYGICRASNPNPLNDDTRTNDNELHQWLCGTFKIDYLQEMDIITRVKMRLECKINITLLALLANKIKDNSRGLVTSSDQNEQDNLHSRSKRAIPLLAIAQGTAAIGSMLIKGINALASQYRMMSSTQNICRATTRPPRPSSTAECLRLIARLRGKQASVASWEPRPPFEATEMD